MSSQSVYAHNPLTYMFETCYMFNIDPLTGIHVSVLQKHKVKRKILLKLVKLHFLDSYTLRYIFLNDWLF